VGGLGLVPNEIVGWRIKPDWYNFTVVLVKRRGENSKNAGQEYEEPVAFCKSIEAAAHRIIEQVARMRGEELQASQQALDGTVASTQALLRAIEEGKAEASKAVAELTRRLEAAGVFAPKDLARALGEGVEEVATAE